MNYCIRRITDNCNWFNLEYSPSLGMYKPEMDETL